MPAHKRAARGRSTQAWSKRLAGCLLATLWLLFFLGSLGFLHGAAAGETTEPGHPAEIESCLAEKRPPLDLLAVRTLFEEVQPSPVEAIIVTSMPKGVRIFVAFNGPVVVPRAVESVFQAVSHLGKMTVVDLSGLPPGLAAPEGAPKPEPLTLLPGGHLAVLTGEPGSQAWQGEEPDLGRVVVVPGSSDYTASGGCLSTLRVLPTAGGVVVSATKPVNLAQSPRETLIKSGGETLSLSTCCARVPETRSIETLHDLLDPEILADRIRAARAQAADVPFDRAPDASAASVLLAQGDFSEATQVLAGITEPVYGNIPEISYLKRLGNLGLALSDADGAPQASAGPRGIEALPGGRLLAGCRSTGTAARPTDGEFARLRSQLAGLAIPVRRIFILCQIEDLKRSGELRDALALLRALAPVDGPDELDPTLAIENILLLGSADEKTLANLYRQRVEASFETHQVQIDLRPYADAPELLSLFSPEFVIGQILDRRLSFGDAAIDARLLSAAVAVAPASVIETAVDRTSVLDRAFADQRFRHKVEATLAARIADMAGKDDAPLSLPALLASADFLRTRASGPSTARLALALARSALNIGLTDMALDLLDTSFNAEAAALSARIPAPGPTVAAVTEPGHAKPEAGHAAAPATHDHGTEGGVAGPAAPAMAGDIAGALPDTELQTFVARYLDITSAIASPGEAVEGLTAAIDQRIRPRHPEAADRMASFIAEETVGFVRDAAGIDGARKGGPASPEARLLERIRQPDLAGKPPS